jgi:hypothetical protein
MKLLLTRFENNFSSINLFSFFRCSSSRTNPVYSRRVNSLVLVFSLSSHRHSYINSMIKEEKRRSMVGECGDGWWRSGSAVRSS